MNALSFLRQATTTRFRREPKQNLGEAINRIRELLHSEEKSNTIGERGRTQASEQEWANAAHYLVKCYQRVLRCRNSTRIQFPNLHVKARAREKRFAARRSLLSESCF
jgi:hypothetical protein